MDEYVHWNDKFCEALEEENYKEADLIHKRLNKLTDRINKILQKIVAFPEYYSYIKVYQYRL